MNGTDLHLQPFGAGARCRDESSFVVLAVVLVCGCASPGARQAASPPAAVPRAERAAAAEPAASNVTARAESAPGALTAAEVEALTGAGVDVAALRAGAAAGTASAKALDRLRAALRHQDETVRNAALAALRTFGGSPLPDLIRMVSPREQAELTVWAADKIAAMGRAASSAQSALCETLAQSADLRVLTASALALKSVGQDDGQVRQRLLGAAQRALALSRTCADALQNLGPEAIKSAVPELAEALAHPDARLAGAAAAALARIGPAAAPAVPALRRAVGHNDAVVRERALDALKAAGESPVADLVVVLGDRDADRAAWAAGVLGKMGPDATNAVPALAAVLDGADTRVLRAAAGALGAIGRNAAPAVPALTAAARRADLPLQRTIQKTLDMVKTANAPPAAMPVAVTCEEGKTVAIALPVTDADDAPLVLGTGICRPPERGTLRQLNPGMFEYRGVPGFVGTDTFAWNGYDPAGWGAAAEAVITLVPDTTPPRLKTVTARGADSGRVVLVFDEPVAPETAAEPGNCGISHGVRVTGVETDPTGCEVTLRTSPLSERTRYRLTVGRITDRARAANSAGAEAEFEYTAHVPGLRYAYFEEVPDNDTLAAFNGMRPVKTGTTEQIGLSVRNREYWFAIRFDGAILIPAAGEYTFSVTSADGSNVYVDGALVVANNSRRGDQEYSGTVRLTPGRHALTVTYWQYGGGHALRVMWSGPGIGKQDIPADALCHLPAAGGG